MPRTPEQDRAYLKAYREKNREKVRAQACERQKRWQANHPEKVKSKNAEYWAKNRERLLDGQKRRYSVEYFRAWRQANPEKARAAVKAWLARHPEYKKATDALRRSRRAGLVGERIDIAVLIARQKCLCTWCGKKLTRTEATVDHIVPVAVGAEGGSSHTYANLQALHLRCNSSKGKRFGEGVQPYLAI